MKKDGFSPLYEKILESYEAADGVCPGVFLDRFDGDEGYENVLVREFVEKYGIE